MSSPADDVVRRVYAEEWEAAVRRGSRGVAVDAVVGTMRRTGLGQPSISRVASETATRALLAAARMRVAAERLSRLKIDDGV